MRRVDVTRQLREAGDLQGGTLSDRQSLEVTGRSHTVLVASIGIPPIDSASKVLAQALEGKMTWIGSRG
jgi:hypothetical protein